MTISRPYMQWRPSWSRRPETPFSKVLLCFCFRHAEMMSLNWETATHNNPPSESVYVHFFLFLLKATGAGLRRETRACRVSVMCQDMSGPRLCLRVVYALRRGHDDSCTSSSSRENPNGNHKHPFYLRYDSEIPDQPLQVRLFGLVYVSHFP